MVKYVYSIKKILCSAYYVHLVCNVKLGHIVTLDSTSVGDLGHSQQCLVTSSNIQYML